MYVGPDHSRLERNSAGGRILHGARNGKRIHARNVLAVQVDEAFVLRALSAHAASGDDGCLLAEFRVPLNAGVRHRFTRRHHSELRETIQQPGFFFVEVAQRIPVADFRAVLESKQPRFYRLERADAGAALRERLPELDAISPERAHHTHSSNGNPVVHVAAHARTCMVMLFVSGADPHAALSFLAWSRNRQTNKDVVPAGRPQTCPTTFSRRLCSGVLAPVIRPGPAPCRPDSPLTAWRSRPPHRARSEYFAPRHRGY